MKKILIIALSLMLATTFMVSCKKVETPKPAEEQTVTPTEPAPAPEEVPPEKPKE